MTKAMIKAKPEEKLDLYKAHKQEYVAKAQPSLVEVGKATYLAIDGRSAPGGDAFVAGIGALYGVAYTVKMTRKFAGLQDYAVCKLECLWGDASGSAGFETEDREQWPWQLLIRTPDFVTPKELSDAVAVLLKRGKEPEVQRVHMVSLNEGTCVQALHVGPYSEECKTFAAMQSFAESKQMTAHGGHHEIYISDPRRVPPEKLKTILRRQARKLDVSPKEPNHRGVRRAAAGS